jgi:RHS repeat-associated protein
MVTQTEYDDLGRVVLVTENADAAAGEARRHTAYLYEGNTGRLVQVAAVRDAHFTGDPSFAAIDWEAADGSLQVTRYAYGALVENADTNGGYSTASTNGAWIAAVYYPDPVTGQPSLEPAVGFTYRFDGQVAERTDARGVVLRYTYDDRDRLAEIAAAIPEDAGPPGALLDVDLNAVTLTYMYTPDGLLEEATVYDADAVLQNQTTFAYGGRRELLSTSQTLAAGSTARTTGYAWEYSGPYGFRLNTITYPTPGSDAVHLTYGDANSLDDRLSRLAGVQSGGNWQARFLYLGLGRQVARSAGPVGGGYGNLSNGTFTGLDRYGRVLDLTYRGYDALNRPLPGLPQFEYGYDTRGNRTFARREAGPQARSWRYGYDGLSRLVNAEWGPLNAAGDGFDGSSIPEVQAWFLDDLGNWAGPEEAQEGLPEAAGRLLFADSNGDGVYDPAADSLQRWERHDANQVNELAAVTTGFTPEDEGETQAFAHDAAGNLVFDTQHYYVYDAWNRLVALHQIGTVTVGTNGIEGEPGDVEARYAYDALGRRVRAEAWAPTLEGPPTGTVTRQVYGSGPEVLAEYDINSNGQETIQRWFIHGPTYPDPLVMVDRTLAGMYDRNTAEYFHYLKDVLGSVVALIDSAGTVVERYDYDPYGQPRVLVGLQGLAPAALHDADGDGLITDLDAAALAACGTNGADDPACVALHDLTADGRVDGVDAAAFNAVYEPGEAVGVPLEWEPIGEPIGELRPPIEEPWPVFRSPVGNPYRWTGQRYDTATALYLFHARTYSASQGHFVQQDKLGALSTGGGEPCCGCGDAQLAYIASPWFGAGDEYDTMSLYEYVASRPTVLTDPFGRTSAAEVATVNFAQGLLFAALATTVTIGVVATNDDLRYGVTGLGAEAWDLFVDATGAFMNGDFRTADKLYLAASAVSAAFMQLLNDTECKRLQMWCLFFGGRDCVYGLWNCQRNGRWDDDRWPLPPEADPFEWPPGYGPD